jgi:hypothetical protein
MLWRVKMHTAHVSSNIEDIQRWLWTVSFCMEGASKLWELSFQHEEAEVVNERLARNARPVLE